MKKAEKDIQMLKTRNIGDGFDDPDSTEFGGIFQHS
jgi:hypothetical protein